MENESSQNVKNALCYIPWVAFFLYFAEKKKTSDYDRHMKYGMILFWVFFVLWIFLRTIFLWFLFVIYLWGSVFFGYRAYNSEDVKIKFLDDLIGLKEEEKKKEEVKDDIFGE